MLTELYIKNFALIEELRLNFKEGFSIISGETGAGKSILVGAIGQLIGGRASPTLIRSGSSEAVLEAVFDCENNPLVFSRLQEMGVDDGEQVIIRRLIQPEGRSRIYVNGHTVTLLQLQSITFCLIDLSSQHEQQILLDEAKHLNVLDSFKEAGIAKVLKAYQEIYTPFQELKKELEKKEQEFKNKEERVEFLCFQLAEIQKAKLGDDNEEEILLTEKKRVKNADFLSELVSQIESNFSQNDSSVLDPINNLLHQLEKGIELDPSLTQAQKLLTEARVSLEETSHFFREYGEKLLVQPGQLEAIESRLYQLHQLKKKFGPSLTDVKNKALQMEKELSELGHSDEYLENQKKKVDESGKKLFEAAKNLTQVRKKGALVLEKKVVSHLSELGMVGAKFQISLVLPPSITLENCGPYGCDEIRFDFSANQGEPLKPLAEIASGGELSRLLLAVKSALDQSQTPITYIFDEVDTGIGGKMADVVGQKLKAMAKYHQVLCVTHLPQIASQADFHYVIEKGVVEKRMKTEVRPLKNIQEREDEIARMLGGLKITEKTKAHAREMLKSFDQNR